MPVSGWIPGASFFFLFFFFSFFLFFFFSFFLGGGYCLLLWKIVSGDNAWSTCDRGSANFLRRFWEMGTGCWCLLGETTMRFLGDDEKKI